MEKELNGLINIQEMENSQNPQEIYFCGADISEFKPKEDIYFVCKIAMQVVVRLMAIFGIKLSQWNML